MKRPTFSSTLHHPRVATVLGRWLGAAIAICFLTGLLSHFQQDVPSWLAFPSRPVSLYRFTQGLHVVTGVMTVPLLLAKLWTVYPKLFAPFTKRGLIERLAIAVLAAATALELFLGFINTLQWYPWPFPFRQTHYALAWIIVGALLVHIAFKLPLPTKHRVDDPDGMSRRSLFRTVAGAAALVGITSVGQSVPVLAPLAVLAPREPGIGPNGLPVNRTAEAAKVTRVGSDWSLTIAGPRSVRLALDELRALPQTKAELPIACVEGWSQGADWEGVRIRDLLALCGAPARSRVRVISLERDGAYAVSELPPAFAADPLTLLALRLNGAELDLDHGYPARLIAPNRPGVLQTKWVHRLEVLT